MTSRSKPRNITSLRKKNLPVIILVRPQLAENIGMAARAMLNCGLVHLRLVDPKQDWPHSKAISASSGAEVVLRNARVFKTTTKAIADLNHIYASTARIRDMNKQVVSPYDSVKEIRRLIKKGDRCGILFGPEKSGLLNDEIVLSRKIIKISLSPFHRSLNLSQAVLLFGYEWFLNGTRSLQIKITKQGARPAKSIEVTHFFQHLESELDKGGFLGIKEKRPQMVRNIRSIFSRIDLMDHEVRTLRGIIASLSSRRK